MSETKIVFKALTGFGDEREVFFGAEDLEKVQYAFLREKRVLLSNGQAVDGKYIQQISPDWHRTMGWNTEHVLDADDRNELHYSGIETKAYEALESSRDRVNFLLSEGREVEIGKNVPLPELERPTIELRGNGPQSVKDIISNRK